MEINVQPKLQFLYDEKEINKYRQIILRGGRGGGKSYGIVDFLLYKAVTTKCRILCLREHSTTNKMSLIAEFKSAIERHNLETDFKERLALSPKEKAIKIMVGEITFQHNGSQIIFTHINKNTVMNLKSIANIDLVFVEESEFLDEFSYRILKPSIRNENSKLLFAFNPINPESFMYKLATENKDPTTKSILLTYKDNPEFPSVLEADRLVDKKTMPPELYAHIWLGEPLAYNDSQVINTDLIGYFDDKKPVEYTEVFLTADTAYSKKEGADYSVICAFGRYFDEVRLLRVFRGRWDFNELQTQLKNAYFWVSEFAGKACNLVIIEKKASGISLLQELERTTHLPLTEITPKTDKYTRVANILSELPRLKLPADKENPLNSWIGAFIDELKMFRADLEHKHDDQVDALAYGLEYTKGRNIDWRLI